MTTDDLWPRTPEYRYRLYARRGDELEVLAASPTAGGLGLAIVTLHEDALAVGRRFCDSGIIGVLDACPPPPASKGTWIIQPWNRSTP